MRCSSRLVFGVIGAFSTTYGFVASALTTLPCSPEGLFTDIYCEATCGEWIPGGGIEYTSVSTYIESAECLAGVWATQTVWVAWENLCGGVIFEGESGYCIEE